MTSTGSGLGETWALVLALSYTGEEIILLLYAAASRLQHWESLASASQNCET